jgi:hypothetical protein
VARINQVGPPGYDYLDVDSGVMRNDRGPAGQPFTAELGAVSQALQNVGTLTWNQNDNGGFVFELNPGSTLQDPVTFQYTVRTADNRVSRSATVTIYPGASVRQNSRRITPAR